MKGIIVVLFLTLLGFYSQSAYAVVMTNVKLDSISTNSADYTLPYPGILPDHPLYFIKVLRDRILIWFTKDSVKIVEFEILFADKRLRMGQILGENGKGDLAITTISKGEKYLQKAVDSYKVVLKDSKEDANTLYDKLSKSAAKHREIIEEMMAKDTRRRGEWQKIFDLLNEIQEEIRKLK